jgi:hypothetical protein
MCGTTWQCTRCEHIWEWHLLSGAVHTVRRMCLQDEWRFYKCHDSYSCRWLATPHL